MIRFGVWRTELRGRSEVSEMKCANEKRGKAGISRSVNFRSNPRKVKGVRPVQRSRLASSSAQSCHSIQNNQQITSTGSASSGIYFIVLPRTEGESLVLCHDASQSLKV